MSWLPLVRTRAILTADDVDFISEHRPSDGYRPSDARLGETSSLAIQEATKPKSQVNVRRTIVIAGILILLLLVTALVLVVLTAEQGAKR
jgi:hypothetical protein